jgi:transcriptional regulator with XRE-family HTH domain
MPELMLAQNIRRLRLQGGMTQEELAERLGVTGQAVSRWERGECCPDITLLPGLSNLFGVTADELLGMEELRSRARVNEIYARANTLGSRGEYREAARLQEQALKTWPDEYGFMAGLAQYLVLAEGAAQARRAIALSETVLANNISVKLRGTTMASLCFLYRMAGEPEKARSLAQGLPHARESREEILKAFDTMTDKEAILFLTHPSS